MKDKKIKVKLFSVSKKDYCCYECGGSEESLIAIGGDWWELDLEEYTELNEVVDKANQSLNKTSKRFILIRQYDVGDYGDVFKQAQDFIDWQEKQAHERELEKKKREEAIKKAQETRKRKQLEKLKKELGES